MLPRLSQRLAATVVAAALAASVSACGDDEAAPADDGRAWNDADVAFATDMIPHHAQALTLVDLTVGRRLSPELTGLAEQIRSAQAPEIEQMSDWLQEWGEEIPATGRDHVHAHGSEDEGEAGDEMDQMHGDMPGMVGSEDLDELESLKGEAFEERWLELMIGHHEGAIEMAQAAQEDGEFPGVVELAEAIEEGQQAEVDQMEQLLAD
ncbi:DUF305 domain-containing protein [Nocardioides ferulae]|uniref:DUF305 domain-containing protein n=1 Tax=Nocardioides ferulae TaxID=2340821 RepID=UPI000F898306|nr:DUF305 domain-containing protein [Nocardioides ferulae]